MPRLNSLTLDNFRIVSSAKLECGSGFNVLFGENGAGKTSVLEALFCLSTARSFRTHKSQYLIQHEKQGFSVFSELQSEHQEKTSLPAIDGSRLGVARSRSGKVRIRLDQRDLASASELAKLVPMIAVNPDSFQLLEGGPAYRRATLDWLVFHVKPQFFSAYRDYQRCLKQRNMLLRSAKIDPDEFKHWDGLLCHSAVKIDEARQAVVSDLLERVQLEWASLFDAMELHFQFRSGWPKPTEDGEGGVLPDAERYLMQLKANFDRDRGLGHTSMGSHRFDVAIKANGSPASELLSRGQKKHLIVVYYLALAKHYIQEKGDRAILLLDDLPSELDENNLGWLLSAISKLGLQSFISVVDPEPLKRLFAEENYDASWFHVKHGSISKLPT